MKRITHKTFTFFIFDLVLLFYFITRYQHEALRIWTKYASIQLSITNIPMEQMHLLKLLKGRTLVYELYVYQYEWCHNQFGEFCFFSLEKRRSRYMYQISLSKRICIYYYFKHTIHFNLDHISIFVILDKF